MLPPQKSPRRGYKPHCLEIIPGPEERLFGLIIVRQDKVPQACRGKVIASRVIRLIRASVVVRSVDHIPLLGQPYHARLHLNKHGDTGLKMDDLEISNQRSQRHMLDTIRGGVCGKCRA